MTVGGMMLRLRMELEFTLTMGRRIQPDGRFLTKDMTEIAKQAGNDAAYCIDAPDEIPGGGMWAAGIDTGDGIEFLPTPLMAPREGKA